jgi:hypothetical protein
VYGEGKPEELTCVGDEPLAQAEAIKATTKQPHIAFLESIA